MKTALCRLCWQPFVQAHPRDHTCDECNDLIDARQWDALDGKAAISRELSDPAVKARIQAGVEKGLSEPCYRCGQALCDCEPQTQGKVW